MGDLEEDGLRLKAVLDNVPVAAQWVAAAARRAGFDDRAVYQIELAVDEACANVVEHAYRDMEAGDMKVSYTVVEQGLVVRVREWGRGFEPDAVDVPDVTAPLEERGLGGLGLFIVRRVMDDVQFSFDPEAGNELVMVKRFGGEEH
jgi:serine/threonine-protein kinase RsbW